MNAKTLFAALAATTMFAVHGAYTNPVGFENYNLGATLENGKNDSGINDGDHYFFFDGTEDESVVANATNFGPYGDPNSKGVPSAGLEDKSLYLSTGDGTLFRSAKPLNQNDGLNSGENAGLDFTSTNVFVDTLVQFTVTEDDAPATESSDKLAIWLNAESNLCVRAGYMATSSSINETTYVLTSAGEILTNTWYRLTVKALGQIGGDSYPGFKIYIDGLLVGTSTATADASFENMKESDNWVVFPSLTSDHEINAVGFKGTGAIDDLVITDVMPEALITAIDFTLTWTPNVTGITLELDGTNATIDTTSGNSITLKANYVTILDENIQIAEYAKRGEKAELWTVTGTNGSIIIPNDEEYTETIEDAEAPGGERDIKVGFDYEIKALGGIINIIYENSAPAPSGWKDDAEIVADASAKTTYPDLADSAFADANALKLTKWAKARNNGAGISFETIAADTTGEYLNAYMLNCDPEDAATKEEEFKANITISIVDGVPVVEQVDDTVEYNELKLKGAPSVNGPWSVVDDSDIANYNFFKFVLEL